MCDSTKCSTMFPRQVARAALENRTAMQGPLTRRNATDVQDLHLAFERRNSNQVYTFLIIFLIAMICLLTWLNITRM